MKPDIKIYPNLESLSQNAADQLLRLARQSTDQNDEFTIALAGGNTPRTLYQCLADKPYSNSMPWGKIRLFFGDERMVPPNNPASNYNMVNDALLKHISIDPLRVHRIQGELEPAAAAQAYELILKNFLQQNSSDSPIFDLVLLGLGADGHIASLFPDTDILDIKDSLAAAVHIQNLDSWRVSISLPMINNAKNVWIFVAGETKQDIVDRVFNHPSVIDPLPVERLSKETNITWFMDARAAHWLKQTL